VCAPSTYCLCLDPARECEIVRRALRKCEEIDCVRVHGTVKMQIADGEQLEVVHVSNKSAIRNIPACVCCWSKDFASSPRVGSCACSSSLGVDIEGKLHTHTRQCSKHDTHPRRRSLSILSRRSLARSHEDSRRRKTCRYVCDFSQRAVHRREALSQFRMIAASGCVFERLSLVFFTQFSPPHSAVCVNGASARKRDGK
jgi:hypothetical protein